MLLLLSLPVPYWPESLSCGSWQLVQFTFLPLKKARSSIGSSGLAPSSIDATPPTSNQPSKATPKGYATPSWLCHHHEMWYPWNVPPSPLTCHPQRSALQWRQRSTLAFGVKSLAVVLGSGRQNPNQSSLQWPRECPPPPLRSTFPLLVLLSGGPPLHWPCPFSQFQLRLKTISHWIRVGHLFSHVTLSVLFYIVWWSNVIQGCLYVWRKQFHWKNICFTFLVIAKPQRARSPGVTPSQTDFPS